MVILSITCQNCYTAVRVIRSVNRDRTVIMSPALEKRVAIDNIKGLLISRVYYMCTRNSCLAINMRPREKTCVPIRVILRFRELCICEKLYFISFWIFHYCFYYSFTLYYWAIFNSLNVGFFFQYHQGVKQFGSRSGPTFCEAWSGSIVCKGYQQMTKVAASWQRIPNIDSLC